MGSSEEEEDVFAGEDDLGLTTPSVQKSSEEEESAEQLKF